VTWHLVTPEYPPHPGGVATWTDLVARGLHEAGEPVRVWAPLRQARARRPWPVTGIPTPGGPRAAGTWFAWTLGRALRPADVLVVANWELAAGLGGGLRDASARRGVPMVVAWHGSDLTRPARRPWGGQTRAQIAEAATNVAVSRFLAQRLAARCAVNATVLPPPVDPCDAVQRGRALLVVARLVASKGVDRALRLAARADRPITVVGDGPERASLEALAARVGARATFLGVCDRASIPWAGHDAVVLLPRADFPGTPGGVAGGGTPRPMDDGAEGLGLVLLEGAARGLATVGSRVGGVPEAALHVLDDPDHDALPDLVSPAEAQAWLAARAGRTRTQAALVACVRGTAGYA
jgi:glycosyltransferase involved in cell wall biosynthesis